MKLIEKYQEILNEIIKFNAFIKIETPLKNINDLKEWLDKNTSYHKRAFLVKPREFGFLYGQKNADDDKSDPTTYHPVGYKPFTQINKYHGSFSLYELNNEYNGNEEYINYEVRSGYSAPIELKGKTIKLKISEFKEIWRQG